MTEEEALEYLGIEHPDPDKHTEAWRVLSAALRELQICRTKVPMLEAELDRYKDWFGDIPLRS